LVDRVRRIQSRIHRQQADEQHVDQGCALHIVSRLRCFERRRRKAVDDYCRSELSQPMEDLVRRQLVVPRGGRARSHAVNDIQQDSLNDEVGEEGDRQYDDYLHHIDGDRRGVVGEAETGKPAEKNFCVVELHNGRENPQGRTTSALASPALPARSLTRNVTKCSPAGRPSVETVKLSVWLSATPSSARSGIHSPASTE